MTRLSSLCRLSACAFLFQISLAAVTPAAGQDFFEIVDVPLVEVDVMVTDTGGRPVRDLPKEAFTLLVDGKEQEVSFFAAPQSFESASAIEAGSLPAYLVILFDNNSVERQNRNAVIEDYREFLSEHSSVLQQIMVATVSLTGLEVQQEFTNESERTDAALERVAATVARDVRASEYASLLRDIQKLAGARDPTTRNSASQTATLVSRIIAFAERARQHRQQIASYIWQLTQALAGLPGQRSILYIGGGVSVSPGESLLTALKGILDRSGDGWARQASASLPAGVASGDSSEIDSLSQVASVQGAAIYSFVVGGGGQMLPTGSSASSITAKDSSAMDSSGSWSPGFDSRTRNESRSALDSLAAATGGFVHAMTGRARPVLERIHDQITSRYVLGFHPAGGSDGQLHRIAVEVAGKRLQVRHRKAFRVQSWDQETAARVASSLHSGGSENPLSVGLEVWPLEMSAEGGAEVPLSFQIPLSSIALEPVGRSHRGQVSVFMVAGSGRFRAAAARKIVLPVVLSNEELMGAMGRVAEHRVDLEVPEGTTQIAVGVRDDLDTRISTLRVDVPTDEAMRVPVDPAAESKGGDRSTSVASLRLPTAALVMSGHNGGPIGLILEATLELVAEDLWRVPVEVRSRLQGDDTPATLDLFAYALSEDGQTIAKESRVVIAGSSKNGQAVSDEAQTILPLELAAGRYLIRVVVRRRESSDFGVTGMKVEIPGPGAGRARWSSSTLAKDLPVVGGLPRSEEFVDGDLELSREEVLAGYRQVLAALSTGDEAAGRDALRAMEMGLTGDRSPQELADLAKLEGRVLANLAKGGWNQLLPLAVLYGEMIDDYRRRRLEPLSEHAIQVSTQLAERMARQARSSEERREAADLLTSLSGYLLYSQRLGKTEELLALAVKEDPGNAAALMALAATREQRGDYVAALDVLETLLEVSPDSGEGRLRWGVNLTRTGKHSVASESLRLLLKADPEDWVAQVATQELARALTELGETAEALQVLESAAVKWPEQPSLRIQLAWLLDRARRSDQAGDWVYELASDSPQAAESARYRYLQWYEEGLDETRRILKELSASHARDLSQRLGPQPEGTKGR